MKDPRLCRLVPLWLDALRALQAEAAFVIPIRNPLEVAQSLEARDGMSVNQGLLLWLRHFLTAERDTRGCRRAFCHYTSLLDDWRAVIDAIEQRLNLSLPRRTHRAEAEIDQFLTSSARHQVTADDHLMARRDVLSWVKIAYKWAVEAVAEAEGPTAALDDLDAMFSEAEAAFNPVLMQGRLQFEHAQRQARKLAGEVKSLKSEMSEQQAEASQLYEKLEQATGQSTRAAQDLSRLEQQLDEREEELASLLDWSKLAVRWATQALADGSRMTPQLEQVYLALESAEPKQLPQLASEGFELAAQGRVQQRLDDVESQRNELAAKLEATMKQLSRVEQERDELGRRLEQSTAESDQRLTTADKERAEVDRQRAAAVEQLEELANVVSSLEQDKSRHEEACQTLAKRNSELSTKLEEACQTLAKRNSELSTKLEEAQAALSEQEDREGRVRAHSETLEQQLDEARSGRHAAEAAIEDLRSQCVQTQEAYASLQERFERCEDERKQALAACQTASHERDKAYALHMKALSSRDEAYARLEAANTERNVSHEQLLEQRASCREAVENARESEAKLQKAVARLGSLEETLADREAQMRAVDDERLKMSERLSRIRKERDRCQASIKDLAAKLEHLRSEGAKSSQELEVVRKRARKLAGERTQLEDDLKKTQLSAEERELLVVIQRKELEHIKSSAAWRLTRPFRAAAGASRIARGSSADGNEAP
ncbi:MAG: hypothetical protein HND57_06660 [Planctomycetes bacterium]|nr:hypothetical protein [Planctomycetota bacterium]